VKTVENIARSIRAHHLFKSFSGPQVLRLAERCAARRLPAGELFSVARKAPEFLCLIESGFAHMTMTAASGRSSSLEIYGPGDVIGCIGYMLNRVPPADLKAITDVSAVFIPIAEIERAASSDPQWYRALAQQFAQRLFQHAKLRPLYDEAAGSRVPGILLFFCEHFGGTSVPFKQSDLAMLACLTEETTCRALAALKRKGLVAVARGNISIRDVEALRRHRAKLGQ
jgi:CRP-like cAMP-binding protein